MADESRWAPHQEAIRYVVEPGAPPPRDAHVDRLVYGLVQPALGVRMLLVDRQLMVAALVPAGLLAAFCAVLAFLFPAGHGWSPFGVVRRFYQVFAALAPLPSVLLARHYARLAVEARRAFGFSAAQPCYEPIVRSVRRLVAQALLIFLAVAPVSLLSIVPLLGYVVVKVVAAAWALHWIVVDAFDGARVLMPGQTLADLDAEVARLPSPWFVRALGVGAAHAGPLGGLGRKLANWCDRLAVPWREEAELVEQHPSLAVGFALTTAALLATPVLNLLFRPIVLIAAVHVMGRLDPGAHAPAAVAPVTPPTHA